MEGWEKTTIATLPPASSFDLSSQGVLVIEENVVRHLSFGGQVIKQYSCEARPLLAIFHTDENCLGLMVVILITSSLIRIFTETGEFYDIPLLFLAKRLLSSSRGIIIESEIICRSLVEETITSRYYIIHRPDAPYVPLQLPRDGRILAVCDSLIALSGKKEISIFSILPHQSNEDHILSLKNDSIISDSISSHYSPATKRIKTKPSRNARHPTSSPESFANALGISGYADTRAISPLSFARIREIDLNRTSITLNTEFSSVYPSMSDESYISAAQHSNHSFDGISYFVLDCLGIISVDTSDNSISFSRDPDGLILVHVLSCDGILKSYRLASDPSMIHLKECILPSRTLSNVSAVIHFHLGKPATALKSYSFLMDLFGTLVIYKQVFFFFILGLYLLFVGPY